MFYNPKLSIMLYVNYTSIFKMQKRIYIMLENRTDEKIVKEKKNKNSIKETEIKIRGLLE